MIAGLKILEVVVPLLALSQPPDSMCAHGFNHAKEDWSFSTIETHDSNLLTVGYTTDSGIDERDALIVLSDSAGHPIWNRTYGGNAEDVLLSAHETSEGGFLIAGYTSSFGAGERDVWLLKTNSLGELEWSKTFGGKRREVAWSMKRAVDGGYVLAGSAESFGAGDMDGLLMKISEEGDSLWTRTFGGTSYDYFFHVTSIENGYYLCGSITSAASGPRDGWVVRTDLDGKPLWEHAAGGIRSDEFRAVVPLEDGGCIACGTSDSYSAGGTDFWSVRFNASGDTVWSRIFGGESQEMCFDATAAADGNFVMCGHTFSAGAGQADALLLKVTLAGDSTWSRTFGGPLNDDVYGVSRAKDGGYVLCGYTNSFAEDGMDFWLTRTGPDTSEIRYLSAEEYGKMLSENTGE